VPPRQLRGRFQLVGVALAVAIADGVGLETPRAGHCQQGGRVQASTEQYDGGLCGHRGSPGGCQLTEPLTPGPSPASGRGEISSASLSAGEISSASLSAGEISSASLSAAEI